MLWLPVHGGEAMFISLASSSSDQQQLNDRLLPLMACCMLDDPRTFEKRKYRILITLLCPWEPDQEREWLHLSCNDQTTAAVTCHVAFWLPAALCGPFSTLCLSKPTHFQLIGWASGLSAHTLSSISTYVVRHDGFLDWSCKSRPFSSSAGPQEPRSLHSILGVCLTCPPVWWGTARGNCREVWMNTTCAALIPWCSVCLNARNALSSPCPRTCNAILVVRAGLKGSLLKITTHLWRPPYPD